MEKTLFYHSKGDIKNSIFSVNGTNCFLVMLERWQMKRV